MGPWCSWLNIPSLQDGDAEYNVGSNPTGITKIIGSKQTGVSFFNI